MTRGRKKKRSSVRRQLFAAGVIVLIGCYAVLAFAEKLTPEEGLLRIELEQSVGSDYASSLRASLLAIQKNELAELWGKVILARKLDIAGDKKLAHELLQSVSGKIEKSNSAAALEASLLSTRLSLELGHRVPNLEASEQTVKQLELYRRRDLEAESLYSFGLYLIQRNEIDDARKIFLSLRERFPTSIYSKSATVLKELFVPKPELREIELLIKEGQFKEAELTLISYQELFPKDSAQFFESLLTKETLLRKSQKPVEADELLLIIAADGPELPASTALFRAAKNSWNENNTLRALELLDQLFKRFPKSSLIPDARYTEARILEELGKLREAEKIYEAPIKQLEKITSDNKEALRLIKSIKRAVWLKFARGDYEEAVELAERALKAISPSSTDLEFRSEVQGLNYWIARSLGEKKDPKAQSIFGLVFESDRRTFYGALSKDYLQESGKAQLSFFLPPSESCVLLDGVDLKSRFVVLSDPKLRKFAQHEIDFAFGGLRANSSSFDLPALLASQSKFSATHGQVSSQIELAEEGLKLGKKDSKQFACDAELSALAYPTPYLELYRKAQSVNLISVPTSLAISRSESYFDPEAKSPVGALGLMQLMPDTAKVEGWTGKPELTDPETNIYLGVKHLKRLLNNFGGDIYKVAASYNAGSGAVNRWTDRYGVFPSDLYVEFIGYPETNKYVRRVFASKKVYEEILSEQRR